MLEELTSFEDLKTLEPEWIELWKKDTASTPFQSPRWLLPWLQHFGSGDILALVQRAEGSVTALGAFFILRDEDDPSESLGMLVGSGNSDYLDVLTLSPATADTFLARIASADCSMWDLQQLRGSSPLLAGQAPPDCDDAVEDHDPCLVLSIEGSGEELQNLTSASFRKKLRYYRRSLDREGRLSFESVTTENLNEFLEALFVLHAARWQRRGLPGMLAADVDQSFHRAVARGMLTDGALRMYAIRLESRIIAVFYGFAHHGSVYYYLSGYDPSLEKYSPGTLLVAHAIENSVRDGAKTFDFLRGAEEYKRAWGAEERMNRRRRLVPQR